jgi:hypothetical protein
MGMMPHPERVADPSIGPTDGQKIFRSVIKNVLENRYIKREKLIERSN